MSKVCLLIGVLAFVGCQSDERPLVRAPEGDTRVAPDTLDVQGVTQATAIVAPVGRGDAEGTVRLTRTAAGVRVRMELAGLTPQARHGVQILHGRTCDADPGVHLGAAEGSVHGDPFRAASDRHAGDLGNVRTDAGGRARYDRVDRVLRLDSTVSAVGRAVVVRAGVDDGATRPDGGSGAVIGCGLLEAES